MGGGLLGRALAAIIATPELDKERPPGLVAWWLRQLFRELVEGDDEVGALRDRWSNSFMEAPDLGLPVIGLPWGESSVQSFELSTLIMNRWKKPARLSLK